ncbi:hypothetical protein P2L57_39755, partial [Streptomyces ferralitis]|nr:hypothetical protein [Streptantibioticus ferralitis]
MGRTQQLVEQARAAGRSEQGQDVFYAAAEREVRRGPGDPPHPAEMRRLVLDEDGDPADPVGSAGRGPVSGVGRSERVVVDVVVRLLNEQEERLGVAAQRGAVGDGRGGGGV